LALAELLGSKNFKGFTPIMKLLLVATLSLLLLPKLLLASQHYYPDETYSMMSRLENLDDAKIKGHLRAILQKSHMLNEATNDTIVDKCSTTDEQKCYRRKVLGYTEARRYLFGQIHLRQDSSGYYIKDVYCNKEIRSQNKSEIGPMKIPNSNIVNCEHTWPQSRFSNKNSTEAQKSDLHHLFPTSSGANSIRGNNEFAEVNGERLKNCEDSIIGEAIPVPSPGQRHLEFRGQMFFEPPDEHKGNVARAIFYFAVSYNLEIGATEEYYLRTWNQQDPVDEEELSRNEEIFKIQNNRNPFVDFPELVNGIRDF